MPKSCKCILDRMVFKGTMTEEERDKIMRNLKGTVWHPYPDEKPKVSKEYNISLKYHTNTTTAVYFTEDDTWYGSDDLYVPKGCISAWAELPERYEEGEEELQKEEKTEHDDKADLTARQILADLAGMSVNDDINAISKRIIFGDKPAEKCWSLTGDYFENDVLATEAVHDNKNDVIIVQLDCLMAEDRLAAFRKNLLAQKKDGIIVIPSWAHVAYVGNECTIEIKEMKEKQNEKTD